MRSIIIFAGLALLTACNGGDGEGSSISITGETDNGTPTAVVANGSTGSVKLDLPGFKADIALPKIKLDADDFDMNGVHLFPGSTIADLRIADGKGNADDRVEVRFSSPAAAAEVRTWFADKLGKAGYKLTQAGQALQGTTDEGKPFRMELRDTGAKSSEGTISLTS